MSKRRKHQAGRYQPKQNINVRCFNGTATLTLFQEENGLWGARDGDGIIEIKVEYHRTPQTNEKRSSNSIRLVHHLGNEVISVTQED